MFKQLMHVQMMEGTVILFDRITLEFKLYYYTNLSEKFYFEDEEILKVIHESKATTAAGFNEDLQKSMDKFRGEKEFTDDIAVLTCRFEG